jgi:hypothetical protein
MLKTKKQAQAPASDINIYDEVVGGKDRYQRWFHKLLSVTLASAVLNVALFVALVLAVAVKEPPRNFAVTNDFRVQELPPLEEEYYTDARLTQWVMQCVPEVLGLDFDKWRKAIYFAQDVFSQPAYDSYLAMLQEKGWLDLVQKKRLLIRCGATSPAVVVKRWVEGGRHTWEVQMPIMISLDATQGSLKQSTYTARLIIERCSTRETPRGVRIKIFQIV